MLLGPGQFLPTVMKGVTLEALVTINDSEVLLTYWPWPLLLLHRPSEERDVRLGQERSDWEQP